MTAQSLRIGGRKIADDQSSFIICEAGVTNYGDVELARRQIDAALAARADAVKFQLWQTDRLVSRRVAGRLETELGYNWFERLASKELSQKSVRELKRYADERGILFLATPHDEPSLEFLDRELDVEAIKVGSGEAHNLPFLRAVGIRRKPVLISFGFQTDDEVVAAVDTLRAAGAAGVAVLHCVTAYPTPPELTNLSRIGHLRRLTDLPVGYSDHSVGRHVLLGAIALGACIVEKHLTFDKSDPRSLDNPGALLPDEFTQLVTEVRELEQGLAVPEPSAWDTVARSARRWAGQSIVAAANIPAGTVLASDMLLLKRPASGGLGPEHLEAIVGRRVRRMIVEDEQVRQDDLES